MKPNINVFWFKRDLRLVDNEALISAISEPYPLFLIYLFEPIFIKDVHTSERHLTFIKQSLLDINNLLKKLKTQVHIYELDVVSFFKVLIKRYQIKTIFSTEETGLDFSYKRDINFKLFCKKNNIKVHVWTINDEVVMAKLVELGINGIMTDKCRSLLKVLQE